MNQLVSMFAFVIFSNYSEAVTSESLIRLLFL